jgi:hypothetical protein
MRGVDYQNLDLPVSYQYCYGRVVELYTHPGISAAQLETFAADLNVALP